MNALREKLLSGETRREKPKRTTTDRSTNSFSDRPLRGTSDKPTRSFSDKPTTRGASQTESKPRFNRSEPTEAGRERKFGGDTRTERPSRSSSDKATRNSSERPARSYSDRPATRSAAQADSKPRFKRSEPTGGTKEAPVKKTPKIGYKLDEKIRLNRFLANSGVCSRREADTFITTGCVTVNGKIVSELGAKVSLNDDVRFNGQQLNPQRKVYLVLNKPKGYVTTTDDPQERKTVMDLVASACPERIYPVGRLDRETTGVLLFTNDGEIAKKLTHPSFSKKKIYHVFLDKALTKADLLAIAHGIELEDGFIAADAISYASEDNKREVGIEIHSGRNRIVRRIFEHFGYQVEKLDRVVFAGLTKKNLPKGKWRFLTQPEINQLKMM